MGLLKAIADALTGGCSDAKEHNWTGRTHHVNIRDTPAGPVVDSEYSESECSKCGAKQREYDQLHGKKFGKGG